MSTTTKTPTPVLRGPSSQPPTPNRRAGLAGFVIVLLVLAIVAFAFRGGSSSAAPNYRADGPNGHTVQVNLTAMETDQTIVPEAPGVTPVDYHVWTFDGTAPGPVIRVHVGDTVKFTLSNASSMGMQHSIDFHAAMTPWANLPAQGQTTLTGNYQPVDPGASKSFTWTAMYPGVFMYHCGVQPVLQHISNGMYGAIIVEPDNLPNEREYTLVQSEFYPTDTPVNGVVTGDLDKMTAGDPKYVVWNGVADQYKTTPLEVRPNEMFRVWVVNAGPTLTSAFHVIGTMFNTYPDGNPANVIYGDQTYNIPPGGAAMFEMQIPDAGLYPFVTHAFAYTGRGAVGLIKVDPNAPAAPGSYPAMGDPFSAGTKPFVPPATAPSQGTASTAPAAGGTAMPSAAPSPASAGPATSCSKPSKTLRIAAENSAYDTDCLAAVAKQPLTIKFDNKDAGVPHNVAFYTDESATKALFNGEIVTGATTTTYKVDALSPGTYFFRCDVHPTTMKGTLTVS